MLEVIRLGGLYDNDRKHQAGSVYDKNGISPALDTMQGGGREPMIVEETVKIKQATKQGYIECKLGGICDISYPDSNARRGRVIEGGDISSALTTNSDVIVRIEKNGFYEQALKVAAENDIKEGDIIDAYNEKVIASGISPTVTTRPEGKKTAILPVVEKYRIRKLIPKECWRLMGFTDEDFEKAEKVNSNSQLYKQAGNSIVKHVLMAIFSQMIETRGN